MALTQSRHPMTSHFDADPDTALLDLLTGPRVHADKRAGLARRDAALDPLLLAAIAASASHTTRNHYQHDLFPGARPLNEGLKRIGEDTNEHQDRKRLTYVSRQAPRRARLQNQVILESKKNGIPGSLEPLKAAENLPSPISRKHLSSAVNVQMSEIPPQSHPPPTILTEVKCMARTRIPTPHGPAFLHLYHNNRDQKEHLAIVIDPAQYSDEETPLAPAIRSRSLDAVWSEDETEMDRIIRGAYVGKLSTTSQRASHPPSSYQHFSTDAVPSPLVRIHSECFTGETVGSMRCDCGEQLDEAIRLISQPITLPHDPSVGLTTMPGRGAVVYLRQEGRGIGLLSKIRAYNLQDLGHDTVTANLLLGHNADERSYEVASAILRDLGLGSEVGEGVRLLTNNPDKVLALEKEGLRVVERVPMVPRSWKNRSAAPLTDGPIVTYGSSEGEKAVGVTMLGGEAAQGEDLDKYLRTKVLRMGHMLPLHLVGTNSLT
ncbi:GTP cyclohydrolase II-domain-containing protein [Hygrophoropsis aurantiaca]|uniref:GTP cyclohydrolase II-domain-containing protein n=1 Tax=Hygrophoropsis aurantiaca TaxID=72124 RepID=A0ACB8ASA7_9AGAM|nr:GTP cyclohydrolase II-domain-containing protein [Hygrophoropsis aurantiaca]